MDWQARLEQERKQKDEYFGSHPHSPLPADEQEAVDELDYYSISAEYRYELPLNRYDEPEVVVVGTSTEGEQEYIVVGEFELTVDSKEVRLVAYRPAPTRRVCGFPFAMSPVARRPTEQVGVWILNPTATVLTTASGYSISTYNPTCAYSDRPLPPRENWLDVPIEAGEKAYGHH